MIYAGRRQAVLTKHVGKCIIYILLILASAALLFPIVYMVCNSFMESREVTKAYALLSEDPELRANAAERLSIHLIPERASLMQYYQALFRKPTFLIMFWNSVIVTVPIVAGQLVVSTLGAYAFAKLRFRFRDPIFFLYIIVMMMPFQVTLVPQYISLKKLGLVGSYLAVILPGIFSTFGVFLLRQFMIRIPDEYSEAAKIDGAGHFRIFISIILPQCKGAMASLAILAFVDNWNMVEQPLIFLDNEQMHPLSIFLSRINTSELGVAFACGILYLLPALFIFLYGENYLIEGIQRSGLK